MAKITVSSKELSKGLWSITCVDQLSAKYQSGGSDLHLIANGVVVKSVGCLISDDFDFSFKGDASFRKFKEFLAYIPEQPLTLEDGDRLTVKCVATFK